MLEMVGKVCVLLITLPLMVYIIYDSSTSIIKRSTVAYQTVADACGMERLTWGQLLRELFFMGVEERKEWGKSKAFTVPVNKIDTLQFVMQELPNDGILPPRILQLDAGVGEETVALSLQCRELRRISCDIIAVDNFMIFGKRGVTNDTFRLFSMSLNRYHAWDGVFPWRTSKDYVIDQLNCNLLKVDIVYMTDLGQSSLRDNLERFLPVIQPGGFIIGGYAEGVDEVVRNFSHTYKFPLQRKVGSWAIWIKQ